MEIVRREGAAILADNRNSGLMRIAAGRELRFQRLADMEP